MLYSHLDGIATTMARQVEFEQTISPFDKLQNGASPYSEKFDFYKEKVKVSPFHKLQNGVSPSENFDFSKKKQRNITVR